jgi:murein L,D-transpeptidase YcbB/YkuD
MERYGNGIRQKPGPDNALGLVKFLFPNNYNIYLHDTPAKSLFGESKRAFSHGCIRLSEAKKLAEFLLRNDADWNAATITRAMKSGRERYVTLRNPVPVFIGYFTAWVDREGQLNFRNDIYGHDKQLAGHLFNIADQ